MKKRKGTLSFTKRVVANRTQQFVSAYLKALGTSYALNVREMFLAGRHSEILELPVPVSWGYSDSTSFHLDYLAYALLRKYPGLDVKVDTKEVALEKFRAAEELCRVTNTRVKDYAPFWRIQTPPTALHALVPKVRSKIARILGKVPYGDIADRAGWGPGVSNAIKGETSVAPHKYQYETGITLEAYDVIAPIFGAYAPSWNADKRLFCVELGSVVTTVRKNASTDRTIAVEPGFNLFWQLGIGRVLKELLLFAGLNLFTQSRNRELSQKAFSFGLATIDFSSASDLIALWVVMLLLPREWSKLLDTFRSQQYFLDGKWQTSHKFSSMGNGFTFELESLIFYACACVVVETLELDKTNVSVFGDDVVLPAGAAPLFTELVESLGFVINQKKSYTSGQFYESCGAHWFRGFDVTPFNLKSSLSGWRELYTAHNSVMAVAHRLAGSAGLDSRFKPVIGMLRDWCREDGVLFYGPQSFGDTVLHSNLDKVLTLKSTQLKRKFQTSGVRFRSVQEVGISVYFDGFGLTLNQIRPSKQQQEPTAFRKDLSLADIIAKAFGYPREHEADVNSIRKPLEGRNDLPKANLVPLKSSTKLVHAHSWVRMKDWYSFGPWV